MHAWITRRTICRVVVATTDDATRGDVEYERPSRTQWVKHVRRTYVRPKQARTVFEPCASPFGA